MNSQYIDSLDLKCTNLPNGALFHSIKAVRDDDGHWEHITTALQFVPDINWNPDAEEFEVIDIKKHVDYKINREMRDIDKATFKEIDRERHGRDVETFKKMGKLKEKEETNASTTNR